MPLRERIPFGFDDRILSQERDIQKAQRRISHLIGANATIKVLPEMDASVSSTSYPDGLSFMMITSASGWPSSAGTVITWVGNRGAEQRIFQIFIPKILTPALGQKAIRTRNDDDTAWNSFVAL